MSDLTPVLHRKNTSKTSIDNKCRIETDIPRVLSNSTNSPTKNLDTYPQIQIND